MLSQNYLIFIMKFPEFLKKKYISSDFPWFENGILKFPDFPMISLRLVTLI